MKLYSRKLHRNVERQLHFGIGQSVKTACGLILSSRHVMVSVFSGSDGAIITDNLERVTCKRCLATRETKLRKLIEIERVTPGIFDHDSLCGDQWLLENALNVKKDTIDKATINIRVGDKSLTLSNNIKAKDRRYLIHSLIDKGEGH